MKIVRTGTVLVIVVALGFIAAVIIKQRLRISGLKETRRSLTAQSRELSATNTSLLSLDAALNDELDRLRQQTPEVLRLRSLLSQAQQKLAAATNQAATTESSNDLVGYVTREKLQFVGLDTPEKAFQSLNWAAANGDYTNWLATLAPPIQEEESTNPTSFEDFKRLSHNSMTGMQVLAAKSVGSDRVELKVRVDSESTVSVFIYPMVAVGNEWRLGDDIESYTTAWDSSSGTP